MRGSRGPSTTSFGAGPALGLSGLALAALGGFAALVLPPMLSPQAAAADETQVVEQLDPALPDAAAPPALQVVREVLGERADFGQVVPAPFGCTAPQAVVSATASAPEGQVGMFVLPTGYGGTWTDSMSRCGRSSTLVPGATAIRMQVDGGQVLAWNRGDVLVTLAAGQVTSEAAAAVDARVSAALTPVCTNLAPVAADATRNPRHEAYAQYTVAAEVSIEASGQAPVDTSAVPELADAPTMAMPRGIAGPPAPAPVTAPAALADPGAEVLAAAVTVPAVDETGPGCGWAFTAAVSPRVDADEIARQDEAIRTQARADLLAGQAQWITARAELEAALPAHLQAATVWNDYVAAASAVRAQWDDQARALAAYDAALKEWTAATRTREAWLTERAAAETAYDEAVRVCAERPVEVTIGGAQPTPAPSASPSVGEPEPVCPPVHPAILDELEPVVGAEPVAPTLWAR